MIYLISYRNFKEKIFSYLIDNIDNKVRLYRGQSFCSWALNSSYLRFCNDNGILFNLNSFSQLLDSFIAEIDSYSSSKISSLSLDQKIAFAQHFGLPTPFLDWTDSPYVALFFAICNRKLSDKDPFRIWCLSFEKNASFFQGKLNDLDSNFSVLDIQTSNITRKYRQHGYFTFSNTTLDVKSLLEREDIPAELIWYDVNGEDWLYIMKELQLMNIHHGNMFDSFEGFAKDAVIRHFYDYRK